MKVEPEVVDRPRKVRVVVLRLGTPWLPERATRPGVYSVRSLIERMPRLLIVAAVTTETASGTCIRFSSTRRAVTTIVSSAGPACGLGSDAVAAGAWASAGLRGAAMAAARARPD